MTITRRSFLHGSTLAAAGLALPLGACVPESSTSPTGGGVGFRHGVASGDPDASSVVIWTRHEPSATGAPVDVTWEISTDPAFAVNTASGTVQASSTRDWTVKVIPTGLAAATTYYYRFTSVDDRSPVGRTRTTPSGSTARLRLAFAACSNAAEGYFHAYRHLAARSDIDAVVHLGDYIYEYGSGRRAIDPSGEAVTLADYRRRYAWYRRDADLAEMHRQHPVICIWDDHEFANDPYVGGAQNHDPAWEGTWSARVAASLRAHAEWMPTRVENDLAYRQIRFGSLATLVLVDRQRRFIAPAADDGDLYFGKQQFAWLDSTLTAASTPWVVLGSPSAFGPVGAAMTGEGPGTRDRTRVLDKFIAGPARNLVVTSGDFHKFRALDIARDPATYNAVTGAGSTAVELMVGSIASSGAPDPTVGSQVRYSESAKRGYALMTITPSAMQTDFYGFDDWRKWETALPAEQWLGGYRSLDGANHLTQVAAPA